MAKKKAGRSGRRKERPSQAERREAMRRRILDATLYCLARYGYAGTGVSQVVARARVSRGAWSHHFPSMNALILEAAQHLMARVYERLAAMLAELERADDVLRGLIFQAWQEFFASEVNEVYLELLIASRRDARLAALLGGLSKTLEQNLAGVTGSRFEARPGAGSTAAEIMLLNRWVLRGLALDAPLLPAGGVERALEAWHRLVATQIRSRPRR